MGVGLIQLKTAVAILAMKLFIGNKRAETKINNIINAQHKNINIENGLNQYFNQTSKKNSIQVRTWVESIKNIMKERELKFIDEQSVLGKITINKMIMDYAYEYQ